MSFRQEQGELSRALADDPYTHTLKKEIGKQKVTIADLQKENETLKASYQCSYCGQGTVN